MLDIDPREAPRSLNHLGHVSAGIGHHVINAFSAIVSNAEILRQKQSMSAPFDPETLAVTIINTALEASSVARRLIDYTRPITSIGNERLALDRLVADYVAAERDRGTPDVTWETNLAPVPPILGHSDYLRAMLGLLVTNSCEAKPAGGLTLAFSTAVDGRGWVVLEIRDTGRGMTTEVMEHAVEPFFTTKNGHIGVGLTIANGIWRRHRGTLRLRSQPNEGTLISLCVEPPKEAGSDPVRM